MSNTQITCKLMSFKHIPRQLFLIRPKYSYSLACGSCYLSRGFYAKRQRNPVIGCNRLITGFSVVSRFFLLGWQQDGQNHFDTDDLE